MTSFVAPYNVATVCRGSVGKDYELARLAKRVLACAVVRLLLFKRAARRQLRFRALLNPRKIPCIVKVNTTIAKKRVFNLVQKLIVVYHRIQKTINERSLFENSIAEYIRQETLERCCRGAREL
jgi:hypothetical protein